MFIGLSLIFGMIRAGEAKTPRDIRIGGGLAQAWRADRLRGRMALGLDALLYEKSKVPDDSDTFRPSTKAVFPGRKHGLYRWFEAGSADFFILRSGSSYVHTHVCLHTRFRTSSQTVQKP